MGNAELASPGHPEGPAVLRIVPQPQGPSLRLAARPPTWQTDPGRWGVGGWEWLPPQSHLHLQGTSREAALTLGS